MILIGEERLVKISAGIAGGSYAAAFLLLLVVYGSAMIFSGETNLLENTFLLKTFVIAFVYIISVYLLLTLPGKSYKRRILSWGFSVIFHVLLIAYIGLSSGVGAVIFILFIPEILILGASVIGVLQMLGETLEEQKA